MSAPNEIRVVLTQQQGYAFLIDFGDTLHPLLTDEPAPLGLGAGPNPSRLLLAAIANCLSASLIFALRKFQNQPGPIRAEIVGELVRNAEGRLRIPKADVEIRLSDDSGRLKHLDRALDQFERFCVVTQSVRDGIDVSVTVRDAEGRVLKSGKRVELGA